MRGVKLPIGPQHPALKEPENFTITLDGERVVDVDIRIGYTHRGIEKLMESRTYTQNLYLVERICGICSYAHVVNFTQNVEEVLGIQIPKRAEYIRTLFLELERLHSHFLWLVWQVMRSDLIHYLCIRGRTEKSSKISLK